MFLLVILIPACASPSPAFLMMYSVCKLIKQGDNIQPWRTPFPIWNQSIFPCPVLSVAFWLAYRFLKRQARCSSNPISFRIFQFVVIHTDKGFGVVNKAEIDIFFLEYLVYLMIQWMIEIRYPVPLPFLNAAWMLHSKCSSWFTYCWSWLGEFFFFFKW